MVMTLIDSQLHYYGRLKMLRQGNNQMKKILCDVRYLKITL